MKMIGLVGVVLWGCAHGQSYGDPAAEDGDADADADGDGDGDGDTDTDTDTDTGTGTGTGTDADVDIDGDVDADSDSDSDSESESDTGEEIPDVPTGVEFDHRCVFGAGAPTSHVADEWTEPELHVVGVYQSTARGGEASVFVDRGYDVYLVVSSYEPVNWTIDAAADTNLLGVYLTGYNVQTADVPDGVEVHDHSGPGYWSACGFQWPSDDGGCDTPGLVAASERETDVDLTSFVGCYDGDDFTFSEE